MSNNTLLCIITRIICLLLLLSSLDVTMARHEPSSRVPVAAQGNSVTMKPPMDHKKQIFRGREVKNCMPKGNRHSSAPSRYVNYHTMGSLRCSTTAKGSKKP